MNPMYVVKRVNIEELRPLCSYEQGHLINDKVYIGQDDALAAACQYAETLTNNMIEADEIDGDDREWKVEYHDAGANIFVDDELAWQVEVVELAVVPRSMTAEEIRECNRIRMGS